MSFINYFKPVTTITADEAREMIKGKKPGEFCLLDVRQPKEYEQGHSGWVNWTPKYLRLLIVP